MLTCDIYFLLFYSLLQDKRRLSSQGMGTEMVSTVKNSSFEFGSKINNNNNYNETPKSRSIPSPQTPTLTNTTANTTVNTLTITNTTSSTTINNSNATLQEMSAQLNAVRQAMEIMKKKIKKMDIELDASQKNLINTISKQTLLSILSVAVSMMLSYLILF